MRILFLHPNSPDYLSAGLFHGMRSLLGRDCVDLPRYDCMYKPLAAGIRSKLRGNGFTLYGLLDDIPELAEDRFYIWQKNIKDFDVYIIADIWNHWETYKHLRALVPPEKIIVIDPSDKPRVFPFNNYRSFLSKNLAALRIPFHKSTKYYKRELASETSLYVGIPGLIPGSAYKWLLPSNMLPIHFSIPEEMISKVNLIDKKKLFVSGIVDEEVSARLDDQFIPLNTDEYKFNRQEEYYADIQQSRFGITTKRSGWDCLRHYEYAANGAVLCFKELDKKPINCAPHGLGTHNCIVYSNYEDLRQQIDDMSQDKYLELLTNTYKWIQDNSTINLARSIISGK